MTDSTSGRIPRSKQLVDQVGPKQRSEASSQRSRDRRDRAGQVSQAVSGLLAEPETRLVLEADNVGLEELVAARLRESEFLEAGSIRG